MNPLVVVLALLGNTTAVHPQTAAAQTLLADLRAGPEYSAQVDTGSFVWTWTDDRDREHYCRVLVPDDYDPEHRYPVYVYMHGSINRDPPRADDTWWGRPERLAIGDRILAFPAAWSEARWWQSVKTEHLAAILERLRQTYNVDENRCYLGGISDGGTGTFYQALRAPTAWAGFLPFIGHPSVLNEPTEMAEGQVYPANLANESLFAISGRHDPKYPTDSLLPYLALFERAGARISHVGHEGGHDVRNWASQWKAMEAFLAATPRDPDPALTVWRTEDVLNAPGAYNLLVDELGTTSKDTSFPRFSVIEDSVGGHLRKLLAFRRDRPSGQIVVSREGGLYTVRSEFVRLARILVSVDVAESERRIEVVRDGKTLLDVEARIDLPTLRYWHALRHDRTRLVAMEIVVDLANDRAQLRRHE